MAFFVRISRVGYLSGYSGNIQIYGCVPVTQVHITFLTFEPATIEKAAFLFDFSPADYLKEVEVWYKQLLPRIVKHLYGKGGNVIMVQVENEYGSFECDHAYTEWLRDLTKKYVDDKAVLFTTDMPNENAIRCGRIPDVFTTIDFGPGECDYFFFLRKKFS